MVRNKLTTLKQEINKYIGVPYFSNIKRIKSSDNPVVGKGTAKEIALKTIEIANQKNIKLIDLTPDQIYNFQKKHRIGIDCSGLVFNLLIFLEPKLEDILIGTDGKKGVRRLSADLLTSPPNATKIENYNSIKSGDLIRIDNGKHIIFVIEKTDKIIHFVHSSEKTKISGVHYGTIEIIDSKNALNSQKWSDVTKDGKNYNTLINPNNGDGFYRINFPK